MSKRPIDLLLNDIRRAIDRIEQYIENLSFDAFSKDQKSVDAVVRNLEIIGEATKKIPSDFKKKYANIEWKRIAGMRDRLIHNYFGVDYYIVWDVATNKLPC